MKRSFGFISFSLLEKEVTLKKTGLKIELTTANGEIIKLIFSLAFTPKTYYSGNKPITTMYVEEPDGFFVREKNFDTDGTNIGASVDAENSNCFLILPAWGGGCSGFELFTYKNVSEENDFCSVGWTEQKSVQKESLKISFVGAATKEEYIQALNALELKKYNSNVVLFSGWHKPDDKISSGEFEIRWDEKYNIPYAVRVGADGVDVDSIIEGHLNDLGL